MNLAPKRYVALLPAFLFLGQAALADLSVEARLIRAGGPDPHPGFVLVGQEIRAEAVVTHDRIGIRAGQVGVLVVLDGERDLEMIEVAPGRFRSAPIDLDAARLARLHVEAHLVDLPPGASSQVVENLGKLRAQIDAFEARIAGHENDSGSDLEALQQALAAKRRALRLLLEKHGGFAQTDAETAIFAAPVVRAGDGQSAPAGTVLPSAMVMGLARADRQTPLSQAGVTVSWQGPMGTTLDAASATNALGEAAARVRLPQIAGEIEVTASLSVGGRTGPSVTFTATALPTTPNIAIRMLDDTSRTRAMQRGLAGRCDHLLPLLVEAVAADSGLPVAEVPLRVDVFEGNGRFVLLEGIGLSSGTDGLAGVLFLPDAGVNRIRFEAPGSGAEPVTFAVEGVLPELEVVTTLPPFATQLEGFQGSALPRTIEVLVKDPTSPGRTLKNEVVSFEILDVFGDLHFDPTAAFLETRHAFLGTKITCHPSRGVSDGEGIASTAVAVPKNATIGLYKVRATLRGYMGADGSSSTVEFDFLVRDDDEFFGPPEDIVSGQAQLGAVLYSLDEDGAPIVDEEGEPAFTSIPLREDLVVSVPEPKRFSEDQPEPPNPTIVFVVVRGQGSLEAVSNEIGLSEDQKNGFRAFFGAASDASVIQVEADIDPNPNIEDVLYTKVRYLPGTNDGPSLIAATDNSAFAGGRATVYFAVGSPEVRLVAPDARGLLVERVGPIPNMEPSFIRFTDPFPVGARRIEVIAPGEAAASVASVSPSVQGLSIRAQALDDCLDPMPGDGLHPATRRDDLAVARVGGAGVPTYDLFHSGPVVGVTRGGETQAGTGRPLEAPRSIRLGRGAKVTVPVFGNPPLVEGEAITRVENLRIVGGEGRNWFVQPERTGLQFGWRVEGGPGDPNATPPIPVGSAILNADPAFATAARIEIFTGVLRRVEDTRDEGSDIFVRFVDLETGGQADKDDSDEEEGRRGDRQVLAFVRHQVLEDLPILATGEGVFDVYQGAILAGPDLFPTAAELQQPYVADPSGRGLVAGEVIVVPPIFRAGDLADLGGESLASRMRQFYLPPGVYSAFVLALVKDKDGKVLGGLYDDDEFAVGQTVVLEFTPGFLAGLAKVGLEQIADPVRTEVLAALRFRFLQGAGVNLTFEPQRQSDAEQLRKLRRTLVPIGGLPAEPPGAGDDFGSATSDPFNIDWGKEITGIFTEKFVEPTDTRDKFLGKDEDSQRIRSVEGERLTETEARDAWSFVQRIRGSSDSLADLLPSEPEEAVRRRRLEFATKSILVLSRWTGEVTAHEVMHALGLAQADEGLIGNHTGGRATKLPTGNSANPVLPGNGDGHTPSSGEDLMQPGSAARLDAIAEPLVGAASAIMKEQARVAPSPLEERHLHENYLRLILPQR